MRTVKICKRCTNFNINEIKEYARDADCKLKFGCLGKCRRKCLELRNKYFGLIDNELIVCDSKEDFFKQMK